MSSQRRRSVYFLAVVGATVSILVSGCGSDHEPASQQVVDAPTVAATETAPRDPQSDQREAKRRAAVKRAQLRKERLARAKREARRARIRQERLRHERAATATAAAPQETTSTATAPAPTPTDAATAAPTVLQVAETAKLHLVRKKGISFAQEGTVTGTLSGSMQLDARLAGKGVEGTFTVSLEHGTLTGTASAALTLDESVARFDGTAKITQGTGLYAKIESTQLGFSGQVAADASVSTVKLVGQLRY